MRRGAESQSRFKFSRTPEFTPEIGYAMFIGARKQDGGMFTYRAVIGGAVLLLVSFAAVALFIWLR